MSVDFKKLFNNKIIKNFVVVFLGDGFSSILTLLNLSIMIRVLGLNGSSNVNLAISYVLVFDTIFNFQSFNSIIKFLPQYIISNNIHKIRQYIQQGFILDIITAIISFVFCNLFIVIMVYIFNLDKSLIKLINVYSFSILFNLTGTSIGIIRVFDKFKYSSYINVIVNLFKFIFYILSFFMKSSMLYFIWIELIFCIVNMVLVLWVTRWVLSSRNIKNIFKVRIKWDKEFLKFNFYCNFMTTLDVPMSHLTPFLINRFIGIEFISVYKVIEKIGGIIAKIASPLVNIIYPEISTKISEGNIDSSLNLVKKLFFYIILFGILSFIFLGVSYKIWINILILDGEKFIGNIMFYLAFIIFKFSFVGVYPLVLSLGCIKYNVYIVLIANLVYLLCIPTLANIFNINGIIISQFIQVILVISMQIFVIRRKLKLKV